MERNNAMQRTSRIASVLAIALLAANATAGFTLGPVVLSAGGGTLSGAGLLASITIGQTLASAPVYSTGGDWKIATGFWAAAKQCPADLNADGFVDDTDFVLFAAAYDLLLCSDPAMPAGCPADLNGDTLVEDSDFVVFANAYNELICP